MKSLFLLALLATGSAALAFVYHPGRSLDKPPPAGKYTGVLTVRRALLQEGLETSFTVKVEARIAADGQMTILSATPESPGAAAKIENSVVRAVPNPPPAIVPIGPIVYGTANQSAAQAQTSTANTVDSLPGLSFIEFSNYLVNGNIPAVVSTNTRMVYLKYSVNTYKPSTISINPPPQPSVPALSFTSNSSPTDASVTANTSPASQFIVVQPIAALRLPETRVTFEYQLRMQRPLPNATAVPAAPR